MWNVAVGSGCGRAFCVWGVRVCVCGVRSWWRTPARPVGGGGQRGAAFYHLHNGKMLEQSDRIG